MIRQNKLLMRMKEGRLATGCQLAFPSTVLVELMGVAGLDFCLIDGEHGTFSWEAIDDLCRVAELNDLTMIARVPNIEASTILRYLDRGIQGIFGPGIDTPEQAQQLTDACYYCPRGTRGLGGAPRAAGYVHMADKSYLEEANSQMFVAAFLEHAAAIDRVDEILAVEGIHSFYVGPQDLSVSMGLGGRPDHPRVNEAVAKVKEAVHKKGMMYLDELLVADRASNFFLNGIMAMLKENANRLK